jgi:cellobiose phosphorylase
MAFARLGDARRAWELWTMLCPLTHAASPAAIEAYKVEPYVMAADVYALFPHVGRGGWTWYTGSAAWTYRLIVESLLGVTLEGARLRIAPCFPADWTAFTVHYRYRETVYHIAVHPAGRGTGEQRVSVDGVDQADLTVPLVDDRLEHWVDARVGATADRPIPPGPPALAQRG